MPVCADLCASMSRAVCQLRCCISLLRYCAHSHAVLLWSEYSILPSIYVGLAVAAVFLGTPGTNQCPAGSVSVGTEAECTSAATALGYTFGYSFSCDGNPKGCHLHTNGIVYFNMHETGAAHPILTPICAGACPRSFVYVRECTCLRVLITVPHKRVPPLLFLFFCCS